MFKLSRIKLDYNSHSPKVRRAIALADYTPAEVLQKLSEDSDSEVRKAIASNPNTPINILQKLGEEFPEAITDNPIFNILLLENPDDGFARLSLARSSTTSEETLTRLAGTEDREILLAIASNVNAPPETLAGLASEETLALESEYYDIYPNYPVIAWHEKILMAIANNINTPIEALKHLDKGILQQVVKNHNTSPKILEKLASDENKDIRLEVAKNPNSSPQILEKLAGDENEAIRVKVARNPHTSARILEKLTSDRSNYVRVELGRNSKSPQILEKLASDENPSVREEVARNSRTSPQILKKLVSDRNSWVQKQARRNLAAKFKIYHQ